MHGSSLFLGYDVPREYRYFATDKVALLIANEQYQNHKHLPAAPCDVQVLTEILQVIFFFCAKNRQICILAKFCNACYGGLFYNTCNLL